MPTRAFESALLPRPRAFRPASQAARSPSAHPVALILSRTKHSIVLAVLALVAHADASTPTCSFEGSFARDPTSCECPTGFDASVPAWSRSAQVHALCHFRCAILW